MSFRIFAAGSNNFHFAQSNCLDDSQIDLADLLSKFQTLEPTKVGAVTTAIDVVQPSKGIIDLMKTMATLEFLHNLRSAVCFLATCSGSEGGRISLSCRKTNLLWADSSGVTKYGFAPGINPGTEFIKKISPVLKETEMANWGVLRMLGIVLAKYANHISGSEAPMINIQLQS